MQKYFKRILLLLFLTVPLFTQAQENKGTPDKNQEKAENKKQEQAEEMRRDEEKGRLRHMKMQTKATRKRMKKDKKKSDRINANKRDPFYIRWYNKYIKKQRNV